MVTQVLMPQMGLEVTDGTIVSLLTSVGAQVAEGDVLLEVETDKALTDIPATRAGFVVRIDVEVGETVDVGATLLHVGDEAGEPVPEDGDADGAPREQELVGAGVGAAPAPPAPAAVVDAPNGATRLRAAPVARRAAAVHGLALEQITGTGPRGRITLRDVEHALADQEVAPVLDPAPPAARPAPAAPAAAATASAPGTLEPLSPTRRAIARRMVESALIPQFALHRDIEVGWLQTEKRRLTDAGPAKLSINDLLVQVLAEVVARHDVLGGSYVPEGTGGLPCLARHAGVDVGLAVAGERGLVVPVLRRVHERTLAELALERSRLVTAARANRVDRADMGSATITLSSLAGFGVDHFNALLNPGETAILSVGRTREQLVPRDGGIAVVAMATFGLTLDHRVADGATGAAALADLADLIQGGMTWRP